MSSGAFKTKSFPNLPRHQPQNGHRGSRELSLAPQSASLPSCSATWEHEPRMHCHWVPLRAAGGL